MSDWIVGRQPGNSPVISPASGESCGSAIAGVNAASTSLTAWPAANRAFYIPVLIYAPWLLASMFFENGGTVSGNVDVGIFDSQGDRLISSGSTPQAGINSEQSIGVALTLLPGVYYYAMAMDNATGIVRTFAPGGTPLGAVTGVLLQASAFPLPASATFATASTTTIPILGLTSRAFT